MTDKAAAAPEPVAWKHDCAALLTNDVELWISNCPHCGKPRHTHPPAERVAMLEGLLREIETDHVLWYMGIKQNLLKQNLHERIRAALNGG